MRPVHELDSCATRNISQQEKLRMSITTRIDPDGMAHVMGDIERIHRDKQPNRPHHIEDWANLRGMSQADLAEALGADKSVISRWFSGSTPSTKWQEALVEVLQCESVESLFRDPNEDWLSRFLKNRNKAEIERIKATLEAAFPLKLA
jgi:ribosome-binding protein aMBF1 (putative translation factor)